MSKKTNGSGNDHDNLEEEDKVLRFPSLAERDRMRKEQEKLWRKQYGQQKKANTEPFFNLSKLPLFIRMIVLSFIIVHIPVHLIFSSDTKIQILYMMGFVPGYFTGAFDHFPWFAPLGLFMHLFIHGGWMHLLFNSVMALALGTFFEREFGTRITALFFLACGLAGAGMYFMFNPLSTVPVIGASGSISGFFGAILILLYQRRQLGAVGKRGPWPIILFWALFMVIIGMLSGDNMAWQAHLGGFLAGAGLLHLIQNGLPKL